MPGSRSDSTGLTSVDEAEDAERDGNIDILHVEFLPQGAEKSVQGKLSRRVGHREGKPDFTWTQSKVALLHGKRLCLNPCFALHQIKYFTRGGFTVSEMPSWHLNSSSANAPVSFQPFQGPQANTSARVSAWGVSDPSELRTLRGQRWSQVETPVSG